MRSRSLFLVFLLVFAVPAMAGTNCPLNQFSACSRDSSDLPVDGRSCGGCGQFGCTTINVHYDIPAGTLSAGATIAGDGGGCGTVLVQDDFTVIGLASGTPVPLTVRMHVSLGQASANLRDAFGHAVSAFGSYEGVVTDLTLDVAAVAGQPFTLQFEVGACSNYAFGGGGGSGAFSFSGLPSGTAVVSCNGYVSDKAVPTRLTSWGRLKSRYR